MIQNSRTKFIKMEQDKEENWLMAWGGAVNACGAAWTFQTVFFKLYIACLTKAWLCMKEGSCWTDLPVAPCQSSSSIREDWDNIHHLKLQHVPSYEWTVLNGQCPNFIEMFCCHQSERLPHIFFLRWNISSHFQHFKVFCVLLWIKYGFICI